MTSHNFEIEKKKYSLLSGMMVAVRRRGSASASRLFCLPSANMHVIVHACGFCIRLATSSHTVKFEMPSGQLPPKKNTSAMLQDQEHIIGRTARLK